MLRHSSSSLGLTESYFYFVFSISDPTKDGKFFGYLTRDFRHIDAKDADTVLELTIFQQEIHFFSFGTPSVLRIRSIST